MRIGPAFRSTKQYASSEALLDEIVAAGGITKFLQSGNRPPYNLDTGHPSDDCVWSAGVQMMKCWDDYLQYATKFLDTLDQAIELESNSTN